MASDRAEGKEEVQEFDPNTSGSDRDATKLEVFFDLVFVVSVNQLSRYLHQNTDLMGLAKYGALFVPIWWAWTGFSYFADQFDVDRKTYFRTVILFAMVAVLALALNVRSALTESSLSFSISYIAIQALLISLYVWAYQTVQKSKMLCRYFIIGFSAGIILWVLSLLAAPPFRFMLWALALVVEIFTPLVAYLNVSVKPVHGSHLPSRLGQFTMIVIGGTVAAVAAGIAETQWQPSAVFAAISGFVISICLWALYFSQIDERSIDRALRRGHKDLLKSFVYGYGHVPILAGIAATGVGIELAVQAGTAQATSTDFKYPLLCGIATSLIGLSAVHAARANPLPKPYLLLRLGSASLILSLALIDAPSSEHLIAVSSVLLAINVYVERGFDL